MAHTLGSATALGTFIPHYTAPHHCTHYVWAVVKGTRWTWLKEYQWRHSHSPHLIVTSSTPSLTDQAAVDCVCLRERLCVHVCARWMKRPFLWTCVSVCASPSTYTCVQNNICNIIICIHSIYASRILGWREIYGSKQHCSLPSKGFCPTAHIL